MNILDIIIVIVLVLGAINGFRKGFFYEAAGLIGLVAGIYLAVLLTDIAGTIAETLTSWNIGAVKVTVFIIIFILVVILVRLIGNALTKLFKAIYLNFLNRIAGLFFGLLKWAFLLAVLITIIEYLDSSEHIISENLVENSRLYPLLDRLNFLF